jgi:hypothetical protein
VRSGRGDHLLTLAIDGGGSPHTAEDDRWIHCHRCAGLGKPVARCGDRTVANDYG